MESVTWLPVILAAIASMVLGAIWYSPALFGKQWMHLMGFTREDMERTKAHGMGKQYFADFVGQLVMAYVLSWFLSIGAYPVAMGQWKFAALLWLGFIAPVLFSSMLWEGRKFKLFLINGGYRLVALIVMALVVAAV